jgi:multidrug efflux pump
MAKFFIDRPIFAWVIALFIMVLGGVAITQLPISQYPPVAPPSIVINRVLPGRFCANAGGQRSFRDRA